MYVPRGEGKKTMDRLRLFGIRWTRRMSIANHQHRTHRPWQYAHALMRATPQQLLVALLSFVVLLGLLAYAVQRGLLKDPSVSPLLALGANALLATVVTLGVVLAASFGSDVGRHIRFSAYPTRVLAHGLVRGLRLSALAGAVAAASRSIVHFVTARHAPNGAFVGRWIGRSSYAGNSLTPEWLIPAATGSPLVPLAVLTVAAIGYGARQVGWIRRSYRTGMRLLRRATPSRVPARSAGMQQQPPTHTVEKAKPREVAPTPRAATLVRPAPAPRPPTPPSRQAPNQPMPVGSGFLAATHTGFPNMGRRNTQASPGR